MSGNIIELLQAIQNERFIQGNAVFNDSVTMKAIEQELEKNAKSGARSRRER